jgi:transcriptional regulator with XRE-family HTH domain
MKTIYDRRYRRVIDRLRCVRRERGLTQAQLAQLVGWGRTTLSKVEKCDRRIDLLEMHALASALGLRLSDLQPLLDSKGACNATDLA